MHFPSLRKQAYQTIHRKLYKKHSLTHRGYPKMLFANRLDRRNRPDSSIPTNERLRIEIAGLQKELQSEQRYSERAYHMLEETYAFMFLVGVGGSLALLDGETGSSS